MKKTLRTTIVCLLIPSQVFAQIPQYRANESSIKPTDLSQVWNALNTDVGQQIVSYIETTVGSIDLEHAKAFTTAQGEIGFVPIKSFSKVLAALCYRQLEDGSEYLFLITYNATQKSVAFTFPSGRIYVMKSSKVTESINPDFQFQEYDDLQNKVSTNLGESDLSKLIEIVCLPFCAIASTIYGIGNYLIARCPGGLCWVVLAFTIEYLFTFGPVLLIITVFAEYPSNSNLKLFSILYALYYYSCFYSVTVTQARCSY